MHGVPHATRTAATRFAKQALLLVAGVEKPTGKSSELLEHDAACRAAWARHKGIMRENF
jgi:hypothetical protein